MLVASFFGFVYFSMGTLPPTKEAVKGHRAGGPKNSSFLSPAPRPYDKNPLARCPAWASGGALLGTAPNLAELRRSDEVHRALHRKGRGGERDGGGG